MNLQKIENFSQFVQVKGDKIITDSHTVAKVFGKSHKNVLRDIQNLLEDCPDKFGGLNFELTSYKDRWNREKPMFEMTKNGFVLLVMGFNGKRATQFKIAFIEAFDYLITQAGKTSYQLLQEYQQLCLNTKMEEQLASYCGKGLSRWKGKKPSLYEKIKLLEDKIQINLNLVIDDKTFE
ncbi:MAG: Rha family transcriptional regulator [Mannheimia varigena]|nr:Rha family transcriptional regulator [Mannheimia varigena]